MNGLQCRLVTPRGTGSNPVIPARALRKHTAIFFITLCKKEDAECESGTGSGSPVSLRVRTMNRFLTMTACRIPDSRYALKQGKVDIKNSTSKFNSYSGHHPRRLFVYEALDFTGSKAECNRPGGLKD